MEHEKTSETTVGAPDGFRAPEGTSRRAFLQRMAALGAVAVGAPVLAACGGGDAGTTDSGAGSAAGDAASALNCNDSSAFNDVDASTRSSLGYIEASTTNDQDCTNCTQFVVPENGGCGTCQVVPGTINPSGWCSVWVEKT